MCLKPFRQAPLHACSVNQASRKRRADRGRLRVVPCPRGEGMSKGPRRPPTSGEKGEKNYRTVSARVNGAAVLQGVDRATDDQKVSSAPQACHPVRAGPLSLGAPLRATDRQPRPPPAP